MASQIKSTRAVALALVSGIFIGWFLLALSASGLIYDYQETVVSERIPPVDVIVCLAGGRGRIKAASDLWYLYDKRDPRPKPVLYFSGVGPQATWASIQQQIDPSVLVELKENNVILENISTNTQENAEQLLRYAREKKWKKIMIVTSSYHMRRSLYIFDKIMNKTKKEFRFETYSVTQESFTSENWQKNLHGVQVTVFEFIKWIYYRTFWTP